MAYAKGSAPQNLDGACGGGTLERTRSFAKTHAECCEIGPYNKQDYGDKGAPAKRTGDKALTPVKPRS